ncbi:hypothetical protein [Endozoicomonas sp. Mp262]|uniref:transposase n=1 Tax=Endozoicomonas sp. Mp262 TaxID=2919499 RepID=UPI0021DA9716
MREKTTKAFRDAAIAKVLDGEANIESVAEELDIKVSRLKGWLATAIAKRGNNLNEYHQYTSCGISIKELQKENKALWDEREKLYEVIHVGSELLRLYTVLLTAK